MLILIVAALFVAGVLFVVMPERVIEKAIAFKVLSKFDDAPLGRAELARNLRIAGAWAIVGGTFGLVLFIMSR